MLTVTGEISKKILEATSGHFPFVILHNSPYLISHFSFSIRGFNSEGNSTTRCCMSAEGAK